jgi:cytoplasmic iron level regulating protein YaaA (DUF328/UPF0246 family)
MDIYKHRLELATQIKIETPFTPENARPAVYAFDGDVYTGLDVIRFQQKKKKFYILSGLYGWKYLSDLIQAPIRNGESCPLEKIGTYMNFGKPVTKSLNKELEKGSLSTTAMKYSAVDVTKSSSNHPDLRIIKMESLNN